jgi:hypothetical protein
MHLSKRIHRDVLVPPIELRCGQSVRFGVNQERDDACLYMIQPYCRERAVALPA